MDYLVNRVIKQQNLCQINNLDILVTACAPLLVVFVVTASVLVKVFVYLGRQLKLKKSKDE